LEDGYREEVREHLGGDLGGEEEVGDYMKKISLTISNSNSNSKSRSRKSS